MDVKYNHEKILIIVALTLCAGILFYNAFFIPQISIPSVIYVDANENDERSESSIPSIESENDSNSNNHSDGTENSQNKSAESSLKVNINTATAEELEKLDGIGPAIAQRIVEYRNTNGKFLSTDEIKNVSGIGEKTFEKFKDDICV